MAKPQPSVYLLLAPKQQKAARENPHLCVYSHVNFRTADLTWAFSTRNSPILQHFCDKLAFIASQGLLHVFYLSRPPLSTLLSFCLLCTLIKYFMESNVGRSTSSSHNHMLTCIGTHIICLLSCKNTSIPDHLSSSSTYILDCSLLPAAIINSSLLLHC